MSRGDSSAFLGVVQREPVSNEPPKPASCRRPVRSELAEGGVDVEKRRRLFAAQDRTEAAPRPLLGIANEAGAHRVERDVPLDFESVALGLDQDRAKAALEDVAALAPLPVRPLAVAPIDVLDSGREVRLGR